MGLTPSTSSSADACTPGIRCARLAGRHPSRMWKSGTRSSRTLPSIRRNGLRERDFQDRLPWTMIWTSWLSIRLKQRSVGRRYETLLRPRFPAIVERMFKAFAMMEYSEAYGPGGAGWKHAMRAIARVGSVARRTRAAFLLAYDLNGDHIRQEIGNDVALIKGLWVLLPRYKGPARRLYRGQGVIGPRKRSYGISWSE